MGRGRARLANKMGRTEEGLPETPRKWSNVRASRVQNGRASGCDYCFPHGPETSNSTGSKNRRSWKTKRKTQHVP